MTGRAANSGDDTVPGVRVLKLYDVVRTAHLERIAPDSRVTVLYVSRRYDFDAELAARVDLRRAGVVGTFLHCLRHDLDVIEVNEPVIARAAPRSLAAIAGNRMRALGRGGRARIVSYAIANKDPRESAGSYLWRSRMRWRSQNLLVPSVWRRIDRLAFGSDGAHHVYRCRFRTDRRWPQSRTIPALPAPAIGADRVPGASERGSTVVFVGDLSHRKGVPALIGAWPIVHAAIPGAGLRIIGKGKLEADVRELESADDSVRVVIDPPRDSILQALPQSRVLVLLSQATEAWREQVGLPIVEGLSYGCIVVTTSETGLAEWLVEHGHHVVPPGVGAVEVAEAIGSALRSPKSPQSVLDDLPREDGRAAAERWMYARDGVDG